MKKLSLVFTGLILCSVQTQAYARGNFDSIFANNTIGFNTGIGGNNIKLKQGSTSGDEFVFDGFLRYEASPNLGIDIGWLGAFNGIGSFIVDQIREIKDIEYGGPSVSLYMSYPITNHFNLYSKLGANKYTVTYTLNNNQQSESKFGLEGTLGIETRFDFGLGFNLGYRYINNRIISTNQILFGTSYSF